MPSDNPRPLVIGPDNGPEAPFPLRLNGKVVKGFGRGSNELGIPTANIPISGLSVGGHEDVESGVYYGWAGLSLSKATHQNPPGTKSKYKLMNEQIHDSLMTTLSGNDSTGEGTQDKGSVYPMVLSIGYNPYYKNTVRSVEVHIMHGFEVEFYGSHMNLIILGFIRPEYDYVSKESLIDDIKTDIDVAGRSLARDAYASFKNDSYLLEFSGRSEVAS
ncbi:riboflavin kinase [Vermiconidia calcicola]|uniref:Riboflavin kinase n=1 Tax=Vermiconidia calcicola TaxID=1690605 RepID=A0ACC3NKT4_9PEZI|nr:riboflavin kinase [Vermiconidia calcicola]